ncbi:hypothetical protein [Streptomyces sp. NPDC102282]|uniref:hypothetical protein n=1 Tax=Streptomyces sp. NPDC102282 TaxID=3366154 RepID=UPI003815463C
MPAVPASATAADSRTARSAPAAAGATAIVRATPAEEPGQRAVVLAPDPMAARSGGTDSTARRGSAALIRPLPAPATTRPGRDAATPGRPRRPAPRSGSLPSIGSTATAWSAKPAVSWWRAGTRPVTMRPGAGLDPDPADPVSRALLVPRRLLQPLGTDRV